MRGARIAGIVGIAAVVGFAAAKWLGPERGATPPEPQPPAPAAAPSPAPEAAAPAAAGDLRAEPGGTIAIESASLEPGRPVVLHLVLGELSSPPGVEPRPVRIVALDAAAEGSRSLAGSGVVDPERGEVRFEVDAAFLKPGRYLVEMRVPSLMPLNLKRYIVEVR